MSESSVRRMVQGMLNQGVSYDEIARWIAVEMGLDEGEALEGVYELMETTK